MSCIELGKLFLVFFVAYSSSHALIYFSADRVNAALESMLVTFNFLMPAMLAASWGIFTYVDNMSKELTDLRNDVDRTKYVTAQKALAAFKSEVIANAMMVFVLFIIEKIVASVIGASQLMQIFQNAWIMGTISLSIRLSFFIIAVIAVLIQMRAFVTAVEYRTLIAINRK